MNETIKLTYRQKAIVNIVAKKASISREAITENLSGTFSVSKATLARDLSVLVKKGLIQTVGSGPSTAYKSVRKHPLLSYIVLDQYFSVEPDFRTSAKTIFENDIFSLLPGVIDTSEQEDLQNIFRSFNKATSRLDATILDREIERYIIELSWKSSKIEGNTYTLLETESLIKQGKEAKGKTKQEAIMILNHKEAFKTIMEYRKNFQTLTARDLFKLHGVLTKDSGITSGVRKQAVGITGTTYSPLTHEWELREALEKMIHFVNNVNYPLEKALLTSTLLAYIQPFADGNKRTARMLANAILLAYDYFPLSYRSVDENEYKQALILFYETNNMYHIKRLFLDQYRFAVRMYFRD